MTGPSTAAESQREQGGIPVELLLELLRANGFAIGVDNYLHVFRLLEQVDPTTPPAALKALLRPLLATNKEEQEAFGSLFDRVLRADPSDQVVPPPEPVQSHVSPHEAAPKLMPPYRPALRWWLVYVVAFLSLLLLFVSTVPVHRDHVSPPKPETHPVSPQPSTVKVPLPDTRQPYKQIVRPVLTPKTVFTIDITNGPTLYHTSIDPLPGWWDKVALFAVGGPILTFLLLWGYRWLQKRRQDMEKGPPIRQPLVIPYPFRICYPNHAADTRLDPDCRRGQIVEIADPRLTLYHSEKFLRVVRDLHMREAFLLAQLDPIRTAEATARTAGYLQPRFKRGSRLPEYLVLIDRAGEDDMAGTRYADLVMALRQERLRIFLYYYRGDPRICYREQEPDSVGLPLPISLEELAGEHDDCRLLILGDGMRMLNSPVELAPWTQLFDAWPGCALLTPTPRQRWGLREMLLGKRFVVLPATLDGALAYVAAREGRKQVRNMVRHEEGQPPVIASDGTVSLGALRRYLGEDGFRWLCVCAVHPYLEWNLTLFLAALLYERGRVETDLLQEESMDRLMRLTPFCEGVLPEALRLLLIESLDRETELDVRRALKQLLEHEENVPAVNSYAYGAYAANLAAQIWYLEGERGGRRAVRRLLHDAPPADALRDPVLLRLVAPDHPLTRRNPIRTLSFFRDHVPVFGLHTGLWFAMCLLLVLVSAGVLWQGYTRRIKRIISSTSVVFASKPTTIDFNEQRINRPCAVTVRLRNITGRTLNLNQLEIVPLTDSAFRSSSVAPSLLQWLDIETDEADSVHDLMGNDRTVFRLPAAKSLSGHSIPTSQEATNTTANNVLETDLVFTPHKETKYGAILAAGVDAASQPRYVLLKGTGSKFTYVDVLLQMGSAALKAAANSPSIAGAAWNQQVIEQAARKLAAAGLKVAVEDDTLANSDRYYRAKMAVAVNVNTLQLLPTGVLFGGANSQQDAKAWVLEYGRYWPYGNLGVSQPSTDGALNGEVKQIGGLTSHTQIERSALDIIPGALNIDKQARWLKPNAIWIGDLLAYFIDQRIGSKGIRPPGKSLPPDAGPPKKTEVDQLIIALKSKDSRVRVAAEIALGKTVAAEPALANRLVAPLLAALKDSDSGVRSAVIIALGQVGASAPSLIPRIIEPLLAVVEDSLKPLESSIHDAFVAFARAAPAKTIEQFIIEMRNNDFHIRSTALGAVDEILAAIPSLAHRLVPPLLAALKDGNSNVRYGAANLLGHAVESDASLASLIMDPLLEALKDSNSIVRYCAVKALGNLATAVHLRAKQLANPVLSTLKDNDPLVRAGASEALNQVVTADPSLAPHLIDALTAALKNGNSAVRSDVDKALQNITRITAPKFSPPADGDNVTVEKRVYNHRKDMYATASGQTLRLWNVSDGSLVKNFTFSKSADNGYSAPLFSPDDRYILREGTGKQYTVGNNLLVNIYANWWDVQSGKRIGDVSVTEDGGFALFKEYRFSSDGRFVEAVDAVGSIDSINTKWVAATGVMQTDSPTKQQKN